MNSQAMFHLGTYLGGGESFSGVQVEHRALERKRFSTPIEVRERAQIGIRRAI
jgi:hypothetical protein